MRYHLYPQVIFKATVTVGLLAVVGAFETSRGQDVVIEDPLPLLRPSRDFMANRPLVQLGAVNKYLSDRRSISSPYNTTMLVFDPLLETPEVEEVMPYMVEPAVTMEEEVPWLQRVWASVGNLFRRND